MQRHADSPYDSIGAEKKIGGARYRRKADGRLDNANEHSSSPGAEASAPTSAATILETPRGLTGRDGAPVGEGLTKTIGRTTADLLHAIYAAAPAGTDQQQTTCHLDQTTAASRPTPATAATPVRRRPA